MRGKECRTPIYGPGINCLKVTWLPLSVHALCTIEIAVEIEITSTHARAKKIAKRENYPQTQPSETTRKTFRKRTSTIKFLCVTRAREKSLHSQSPNGVDLILLLEATLIDSFISKLLVRTIKFREIYPRKTFNVLDNGHCQHPGTLRVEESVLIRDVLIRVSPFQG